MMKSTHVFCVQKACVYSIATIKPIKYKIATIKYFPRKYQTGGWHFYSLGILSSFDCTVTYEKADRQVDSGPLLTNCSRLVCSVTLSHVLWGKYVLLYRREFSVCE